MFIILTNNNIMNTCKQNRNYYGAIGTMFQVPSHRGPKAENRKNLFYEHF